MENFNNDDIPMENSPIDDSLIDNTLMDDMPPLDDAPALDTPPMDNTSTLDIPPMDSAPALDTPPIDDVPLLNIKQMNSPSHSDSSMNSATINGKIPPQAIDSEKYILGSFLIDKESVTIHMSKIKDVDFYVEKHAIIFRAMKELEVNDNPVDVLTVVNQLKESNKYHGNQDNLFLFELSELVASSANIEYHIELVLQKSILRRLITACSNTINNAFDPGADKSNVLEKAQDEIYAIAEENVKGTTLKAADIVDETLKMIIEYQGGINGVETGFAELDELTSGLQKTDMIVVAGRPGMGKTAFALSLLANATIKSKKPAKSVFFSLEMAGPQLIQRVLCGQANISMQKIKENKLTTTELNALIQKSEPIAAAPMYIDDQPGLSMAQLRSKCRSLERQLGGLDLVIIDYLQLMEGDSKDGNRNQEVSKISRGLKMLAKDLQVPVIALSQLNRKTEDRPGAEKGIPQLSDLRDSGAIEQDADMVWFVHRPSRYKSRAEMIDGEEEIDESAEEANLIIAKNRHGPTKTVKMAFIKESASFVDFESYGYSPNF